MREGWTYKRLNEVCDKGSSNIVINKLEDNNGNYPLYGASGLVKKVDFYHQDKPYIGIVKDGAGVGRVNTYPAFSSLVGTMQYIFAKEDCLLDYIKYFLIKLDLSHCVSGATIPHIYFKDYGKARIPVPTIDVQQSIVAELDKINELIGLKKSQLSDLDSIAQSIFYEMFGDPVKGIKFERSTIGNIITNIKYGTGSPPQFSDSGFCFIRATNIKNGHIDSKDMMYIDANEASRIEKCRLSSNDLIIVRSGVNAGDTSNIPTEYVGHYAGYDIIITVNKELVNTTYINGVLNNKDYVRMIIKPLTRRAAQPHLNSQQVQGMSIPLPPLPLQQSFAARIIAIEQQKQRISSSIKDLETLLASRMQYWFD